MGELDMNDDRVYDAIKEGVCDAIWQMITNATDMPTADFFEFVKQGVVEGIEKSMPSYGAVLEAMGEGVVKALSPTTDLPGTGYITPTKTCDETKGNYDENPLLALYDEVIQQCMIREVVGKEIGLSQEGETQMYRGVCPFHQDHKPSLQVNTESQKFKCLSCGESGDVVDFVMKLTDKSEKTALFLLAGIAGFDPKEFLKDSEK